MGDSEKVDNANPASIEGGDHNDLLNNPSVLASLQELAIDQKGKALLNYQNLPQPIKRRVKALKKLQYETIKIESEFFKELNELEIKYASKYQPFYDRRREVLNGEVEPNDEDCEWASDDENDMGEVASTIGKLKIEGDNPEISEKSHGIPEFWLTIFRNVQILSEMIEEHDIPILKSLKDITCTLSPDKPSFTLHFYFAPNDYFTDSVLHKQYFVKYDPMPNDLLSFEGPEIIKAKGCEIHWKHNKNVTVKLVKKVQKHKGRGEKRTVTKTMKTDSFFNFFDPPAESLENPDDELDPETEQLLQSDFEIGQFLRERVIPKAVLFYTGEALDDDDDDFEEEEEGEEEDFDENDDGNSPPKPNRGKGHNASNQQEGQPDCKQQ